MMMINLYGPKEGRQGRGGLEGGVGGRWGKKEERIHKKLQEEDVKEARGWVKAVILHVTQTQG